MITQEAIENLQWADCILRSPAHMSQGRARIVRDGALDVLRENAINLEWGSADQIEAENAYIGATLPALTFPQRDEFHRYQFKATTREMIEFIEARLS